MAFQGHNELKNHLAGKRLTRKQAMQAKCYECMGHYDDGRADCKIDQCPMYLYMPYREEKTRLGKKTNRTLTDDQKQKMAEGRLKNKK